MDLALYTQDPVLLDATPGGAKMTLAPIQCKCPVCHQDSANTAFQAGAASRDAEIESLRQQLADKQAIIDGWLYANGPNGWIESLRQQLTEKESQRQELMRAFERQGNSAQEVIIELRQKLATALAACKAMDEALELIALDGCCISPAPIAEDALAIQPDDSALKDKAMTTYEQPKDWIERHLVEDPGGLLACEPSRLDTLNEELRLARQANEAQHQQLAAALDEARMANVSADEVRSTYAEEMRKLRKQLSNHIKREVMLRDALSKIEYLESDNGSILSAGACSSIATEALAATTADLDGLILCKKKPTAWCRDVIYEMPPEFAFSWFNTQLHYLPLYRAWEPK